MILWLLLLFASILLLFCGYWVKNFNYWKKRNVPHPPYSLIFGNLKDLMLQKKSLREIVAEVYGDYKDLNYVGFYKMRKPTLIIRNAELAKSMLVKEFESFHDNDVFISAEDPIGKNPFFLKGKIWKNIRQVLQSAFTPKKLKLLVPIFEERAKKMISYISNIKPTDEEDKTTFSYFAMDNVVMAGFGLQANAFEKDKEEVVDLIINVFTNTFNFSFIRPLIPIVMPDISSILNLRLLDKKPMDRFKKIHIDMLKYRLKNSIIREDYMNTLVEAYNSGKFNEDDVAAEAFTLYLDGIETSAQSLTFVMFDLACHPDVQAKIRLEIDEVVKGELTYETLQQMKYLDCVVNESLRLHSPFPVFQKVCTKRFKLPPIYVDGRGPEFTIEPGTVIFIPTKDLHLDPRNYDNPKNYYPERFLNGTQSIWIPFGNGPRICLGMRFALLQIKVAIIYLVKSFKIKLNSRTKNPLEWEPVAILELPKGGIWFDYEKLTEES